MYRSPWLLHHTAAEGGYVPVNICPIVNSVSLILISFLIAFNHPTNLWSSLVAGTAPTPWFKPGCFEWIRTRIENITNLQIIVSKQRYAVVIRFHLRMQSNPFRSSWFGNSTLLNPSICVFSPPVSVTIRPTIDYPPPRRKYVGSSCSVPF